MKKKKKKQLRNSNSNARGASCGHVGVRITYYIRITYRYKVVFP